MSNMNLDLEEVTLIQTLRAARLSEEKNASQQFRYNNQDLKIHVYQDGAGRWLIRITVKREE